MNFQMVYDKVEEVERLVVEMGSTQKADHAMLLEHDKYLVRGNGVPSLQETVRNLTKDLSAFIVEVRNERDKRNKLEEAERERKRTEQNKWKWTFIGVIISLITPILIQAVYFWTNFAPIIENLKDHP